MKLALTTAPPERIAPTPGGDLPWALGDVQRLLRVTLAALFVVLACFAGSRNTDVWDYQLYWLVGAMAAMLVAAYSWTMWLLTGARALRIRQRALEIDTRAVVDLLRPASLAADGDVDAIGTFVTAPGMSRYHRPGCLLVRGRALEVVHDGAPGLEPCRMCL